MTAILHHEVHEEREGYAFDAVSRAVIGAAIEVHRELGPGLLESAYRACLAHELSEQGFECRAEVPLPVAYKGQHIDCGYRLDLVFDDSLLLELKSVESLHPIHSAQVLTYLKLSGLSSALLINFNVPLLKSGIRRFVA